MEELQKAILKTLSYADIFDYPLALPELHHFLIGQKASINDLAKALTKIKEVTQDGQFFFLKNRRKIVQIRRKRFKWSQNKLQIAQKVAKWLELIPFIKMIAVTGNLAMNNSDKNDDIDLLVVTTKNRLWLTRLLTVFWVELVANRRHPQDVEVKDKICLNMFLDENHLQVPLKEQDLFSAHEVCQTKLLWDKNETYQKFLKANQWYKKYLANWKP
jgi:predicted nucleotidyltransferase